VTISARLLAVCCAASLVLIVPATAGATASSNLGNGSGVSQYTSQLHNGARTVTPGVGKSTKAPLDMKSARALRKLAKSAASVLKKEVTLSGFGAVPTNLQTAKTPAPSASGSSLVGSLLGSISSPGAGSEGRLIALLGAIVTITAALGIAAARKQRALHQIRH
jgi:hypothetical protein